MLVVDAPSLNWTQGVEYFLCEPPQGNLPWTEDAGEVRKMWYQTAGQGIVELSADVIMNSVEGIYMRSHCWLAAKEWQAMTEVAGPPGAMGPTPPMHDPSTIGLGGASITPLAPPVSVFQDMDPVRGGGGGSASRPGSAGTGVSTANNSPRMRPMSGRNHSPSASIGRASHAWRSSIAIGLEPLPLTEGGMLPLAATGASGYGGERRASRIFSSGAAEPAGPAALQADVGHVRSRSIGNMRGAAASEADLSLTPKTTGGRESTHEKNNASGSAGAGGGGSTFDDILKGMDKGKSKAKKRSFF